MRLEKDLEQRSDSKCELCGATHDLSIFEVAPSDGSINQLIYICSTCKEQIETPEKCDPNHWRCLNESMWSEIPAVQVQAWRMLQRLKNEGWPQDLLDMLYLDDDTLNWAKATGEGDEIEEVPYHKDCNGVRLQTGDTVVLIKDLNVKGGGFTAKRGTAVRGISLDMNNPTYIEGKVNGQTIVIITEYVKKS